MYDTGCLGLVHWDGDQRRAEPGIDEDIGQRNKHVHDADDAELLRGKPSGQNDRNDKADPVGADFFQSLPEDAFDDSFSQIIFHVG